jgi:hypothetical protein
MDARIRKHPDKRRIQGNISIACTVPIPSWLIIPKLANTPNNKTDVALVGPSVINRELENKQPRIAATADPKSPYWMGRPETKA